jgi:hypothetical protein
VPIKNIKNFGPNPPLEFNMMHQWIISANKKYKKFWPKSSIGTSYDASMDY